MAANYKTLADFEVATAEEAQGYFMDQAIIKVDSSTDLASLPTTVKTAYVLNTGILMARNVANAWVPMGGVATVSDTAPSNPQTGQLWVKPSEVLPAPVRVSANAAFTTVNATAWGTTYGTTASITLPKAAMCTVGLAAWVEVFSSTGDLRMRLKWTGALTGTSFDQQQGWAGIIYVGSPSNTTLYNSANLNFTLVLPAGTTTFAIEAYKGGAGTSPQFSYATISVTPTQWADAYAAGVA